MTAYPGTVIHADNKSGKDFLDGLFLAGNIMMSQICALTGLCTPTLQNWVARGFLPRPEGKRYTKNQLSRILIINSLRKTMKLDDVQRLLIYVNGDPDDDSDNIVEESELYNYICSIVLKKDFSLNTIDNSVIKALLDYREQYGGAYERLRVALSIICKKYIAASLLDECEQMLASVTKQNIFGKHFN